jgi:hypothetical protein
MNDTELEKLAAESEGKFQRRARTMKDFMYDEQQEKYWDTTTGHLLAARSVDGAIPKSEWPTRPDGRNGEPKPYPPSRAINDVDTGLTVEGSTWWPGRPRFIEDIVMSERGAMRIPGAICYNCYVPPNHRPAKKGVAPDRWIKHVKKLYSDPLEHNHFFDFCAHMLQKPHEKINHGIVMAGSQGIGKDTALLPIREGVGEWNAAEVGPDAITSQYNGFLKSVLLVINEVRPHDEEHKASNFYNLLKPLLASPPEMLPMTLKYANTIHIRNLCHVLLTTNDPLSMYIPAEDRRLFVMTSALKDPKTTTIFPKDYFNKIHDYLADGGTEAVIEWLYERDISNFRAAAPPPMTRGKQAICESATQVRRTPVDDVLDSYFETLYSDGEPEVIFHRDLTQFVKHMELFDDEEAVIKQLNTKHFHFKMNDRGYDLVKNPHASEWKNGKFRTRMAFVLRSIPFEEQASAAQAALAKRPLAMTAKK